MMIMHQKNPKKLFEKFHSTAVVKRTIIYEKSGMSYRYKEEDHSRQLLEHDWLTDSRVIEATSRQGVQFFFWWSFN